MTFNHSTEEMDLIHKSLIYYKSQLRKWRTASEGEYDAKAKIEAVDRLIKQYEVKND